MLQFIRRKLRDESTQHVIINTVGNYLNVFFTALYFLVLVRALSRHEYGILSVLFAIVYILANVLDFGVTASIYSRLPGLLPNRDEVLRFIKANFLFQFALSTVVLILLFIFIEPVDKYVLKLDAPLTYYFWIFISIPLFICQNFALNVLYATKKFLYANAIINFANIVKTAILFFLIFQGQLTILNVIITIGIIGQLIFVVLVFLRQKRLILDLLSTRFDRGHISLRYTLTFFAATQVFNFASRIDLFMLSYFLSKALVGDYGLAQKIILTVLTFVNSITQVLSPQFAKVEGKKALIRLLRKSYIFMAAPIGAFIILIIAPTWVYLIILPDKWTTAISITRQMSVPYIFYAIVAVPTLFFLYTIKKPFHLFVMNTIFLLIITIGCYIYIPKLGVTAPIPMLITGFIVVAVYIVFFFGVEYRKLINT